ncbi:MAG: hypothetical protein Q8M05_13025 [Rhodoferax sp.]|uniref:hypothetical protein n=1 Tax=Rhodoferax sp. TaxID=50421 RepID=UPI0027303441|nr:hypothetical protein [Rhodoferax sp.]MDP1530297.1 hypothetical protein [Rhodoferax sp.]MDP1943356.1 hypothetical protein [Rhodoferax sp.]
MKKTETKIESKAVLIRLPAPLLKKVDAAAKEQRRSRTAEVCLRLAASMKASRTKAEKVAA